MKLQFKSPLSETPVIAEFNGMGWDVSEGDKAAVQDIERAEYEAKQGGQYFPSLWDFTNEVAGILGGVMLEPSPSEEPTEGSEIF